MSDLPSTLTRTRRAVIAAAASAGAASLAAAARAVDATPPPSAGSPPTPTTRHTALRMVARWRRHGLTAEGFDEFLATLARCGIAVRPEIGAAPIVAIESEIALDLLAFQAHNHYAAIVFRNDIPAPELDNAIAAPAGAPPPSLIMVAWVRSADTPAAEFARAILADQALDDPTAVRFPAIIGVLLAADIARDVAPAGAGTGAHARRHVPALALTEGPCSTVSAWIDETVAAMFTAMRIATTDDTGAVGAVLSGIWNVLVDVAQWATRSLITSTLQQVMPLVRAIAGMLGVAGQIVGILQPWSVAVVATPTRTRFGVDGETITGAIAARVVAATGDWPATIRDCATVAGITLPSLTAAGAPVTWTLTEAPIDLVDHAAPPATLDDDGTAAVSYTTLRESGVTATGGERSGVVDASIVVARNDLDQLAASVQALALANVPDIVRGFIEPVFGPLAEDLLDRLVALASVRGRTDIVVLYHDPPEPTPMPDPATTRCIVGSWTLITMLPTFNSLVDIAGGAIVYSLEEGLSEITFRADGTFLWTYTGFRLGNGQIVGMIGEAEAVVVVDGSIGGEWLLQGDLLTFPGTISLDLAMTVQAYIDGVLIMEEPLGNDLFAAFADSRGFRVTCGDRLHLLPLWLDTAEPMIFRRS